MVLKLSPSSALDVSFLVCKIVLSQGVNRSRSKASGWCPVCSTGSGEVLTLSNGI
jgi:hypothetical protein